MLGSPGKSGSVFFLSDDDRWAGWGGMEALAVQSAAGSVLLGMCLSFNHPFPLSGHVEANLPWDAPPACRFLVKTVGKEEMRLLLRLIPRYFRHVAANPATLLVRFYGVHRVSPLLGRRVSGGSPASRAPASLLLAQPMGRAAQLLPLLLS